MVTSRLEFDREKVVATLSERWGQGHCPFGHDQWDLVPNFVEVRPYHGGGMVIGSGGVYPAVMVICQTCGYMAMFSAVKLGLLPGVQGGS